MRTFNGKILLRVSPEMHEELAREAFESGRSINRLCLEAIKHYDPWKSIEKLWDKNKDVDAAKLGEEIRQAILEFRRGG